jgi:hypothetical protein
MRQTTIERRDALSNKVSSLGAGIRTRERAASIYAELFSLYAPFALVESQITVGPIEWVQQ